MSNPHCMGHGKPNLEDFLRIQVLEELGLRIIRSNHQETDKTLVLERTLKKNKDFARTLSGYSEERKKQIYLSVLHEEEQRVIINSQTSKCALCKWQYEDLELPVPCQKNPKKYKQLEKSEAFFCEDYTQIREDPNQQSKRLEVLRQFRTELEQNL